MRLAIIGAVLLIAGCATPAHKLANDQCHGHWRVVTTQVHGKAVYSAVCAGSKP
jgi:hypothetical protein